MKRKWLLLTIIILLVLSNTGTYLFATGKLTLFTRQGSLPEGSDAYQAFLQVLGYIQTGFVDEERALDAQTLIRGATAGLVDALEDPYSLYMTADEYRQFMSSSVSGNYTGVGIEIVSQDGYITVVAPIKNTPAYRSGILPLDQVLAVDGVSIVGWTTNEASEVIRGTPGTTVVLTIRRVGTPQPFDLSIVREAIKLTTVESKMLEPGIGYVQLTAFREDTAELATEAVAQLRTQGMRALILDLRDNPGGLLDESIDVSDIFVPAGLVVSTVFRDGSREEYKAVDPGLGMPLVVLINGASASAAEITAGAIQDREAGILVGVKSFGKATVQHLFTLKDGSGLKLTVARYLTPNGRDINRQPDGTGGIEPDVVVENLPPEGELRVQLDDPADPANEQLRRALELAREQIK